jgi:hypothetical protein
MDLQEYEQEDGSIQAWPSGSAWGKDQDMLSSVTCRKADCFGGKARRISPGRAAALSTRIEKYPLAESFATTGAGSMRSANRSIAGRTNRLHWFQA